MRRFSSFLKCGALTIVIAIGTPHRGLVAQTPPPSPGTGYSVFVPYVAGRPPSPSLPPEITPHQKNCQSVDEYFAHYMVNRLRDSSVWAAAIEEVKRLLKARVLVEPAEMSLNHLGEQQLFHVQFLDDEIETILANSYGDALAVEVESKIDSPEITSLHPNVVNGELSAVIEFRGYSIKSEDPLIASIVSQTVNLDTKVITGEVKALQAGKTKVSGGIGTITIKFKWSYDYTIDVDDNGEEEECPSHPIANLSFPITLELDSFQMPVTVKDSFPGEVKLVCTAEPTGIGGGASVWLYVTLQTSIPSFYGASFILTLRDASGPIDNILVPAPWELIVFTMSSQTSSTSVGNLTECNTAGQCSALYVITQAQHGTKPITASPPVERTVTCKF